MATIRHESVLAAQHLGYSVNKDLPLLDEPICMQSEDEVIERTLALHPVVAVAHGGQNKAALAWLKSENLVRALTARERKFLAAPSKNQLPGFRAQEEALWALVWALGLIPKLDLAEYCTPALAGLFPKVLQNETSARFRAQVKTRTMAEIVSVADLAYCIHSAIRDWAISGKELSRVPIEPYVIVERRRALEWLIGNGAWDDIPLDT